MGLEAKNNAFFLDGKKTVLLSGAVHYFRIVPDYWKDRLLKVKAAGLNCVETYVPWNLHEEVKGEFRFDRGLDVRKFILTAQEVGLHVLFRPGPYICSEWDFGGLPSWLLSDPKMKVRTSYQPYLTAVEKYFSKLLPLVEDLQYSKGGPIIAVQLENEYGSYGNDLAYKTFLKDCVIRHGITELLFTSDNGVGIQVGEFPDVLVTANFQEREHGYLMFEYLKNIKQPGKPLMVMEFWSGWFDHWGGKHSVVDIKKFESVLRWILEQGSSVNFYMYHGGTNFGWMAGANEGLGATNEGGAEPYAADVTSYDYDCPISESGELTEKFHKIREIFRDFASTISEVPEVFPEAPAPIPTASYGDIQLTEHMTFDEVISHTKPLDIKDLVTMEMLDINNGGGQGYGYTLYRKSGVKAEKLTFTGRVRDRAIVYQDGQEVDVVDHTESRHVTSLRQRTECVVDVLVENMGRVNYADFGSSMMDEQRKGLCDPMLGDSTQLQDWQAFPLEFKARHVRGLVENGKWKTGSPPSGQPCLYKGCLTIDGAPKDTFVNMSAWNKGIVFVNGFNLGRYWKLGPQLTLFLPAPLLKSGSNEIVVFELHSGGESVRFDQQPNLGPPNLHTTVIPGWAKLFIFSLRSVLSLGPWVWRFLRLVLK